MALVSSDYYHNTFMGLEVASTSFNQYNAFAQRAVFAACMGRVTESNFPSLPPFQQEAVLNAICAQISSYEIIGLDSAITADANTGFTVGKVTVHGAVSASASGHASMLCALALATLEQSGLLNPQVDSYSDFYQCSYV